jgi:hypothetical protein
VGNKVRESVQAIVECAGVHASITKISSNPVLAAMEIRGVCVASLLVWFCLMEWRRMVQFFVVYNHVADFCEQWNEVIDICNGRHGPHSPDNAAMRQTRLLDTLVWFSQWKELHDERVRAKLATEYNFFANETWFCIKPLLLAHITVAQIYCVMKGESISPRTMNTDTVECFLEMPDRWWVVAPIS